MKEDSFWDNLEGFCLGLDTLFPSPMQVQEKSNEDFQILKSQDDDLHEVAVQGEQKQKLELERGNFLFADFDDWVGVEHVADVKVDLDIGLHIFSNIIDTSCANINEVDLIPLGGEQFGQHDQILMVEEVEQEEAIIERSTFGISRGCLIQSLSMIEAKQEFAKSHTQVTNVSQTSKMSDQQIRIYIFISKLQGFLQLFMVLPSLFQLYILFQSHANHPSLFREGS